MPPKRRPRRNSMTTPAIAPARATNSHRSGARPPKSENGVVSRTGSGLHDGPSTVERSRCMISRPQMIQAHGSYVGAAGARNGRAVSPSTASVPGGRTAAAGRAGAGSDGRGTVSARRGGGARGAGGQGGRRRGGGRDGELGAGGRGGGGLLGRPPCCPPLSPAKHSPTLPTPARRDIGEAPRWPPWLE